MSVFWSSGTGITLSNNNLTAQVQNSSRTAVATVGSTSGKYFWEITINSGSGSAVAMGITNDKASLSSVTYNSEHARNYYSSGKKYPDNIAYGEAFKIGDVIGIFLDIDNQIIEFFKNGVSQGTAFTTLPDGVLFPSVTSGGSSVTISATANFGATEFKYLPESLPKGTLSYDKSQKFGITEKTLFHSNNKVYSLELFDFVYETKMTSNTAPSPLVASASSQYNSTYQAWKAFNGTNTSNTDCWLTADKITEGWIQIDLGEEIVFNNLRLTSRASGNPTTPTASPRDFNILGSNNNIDFTLLAKIENEVNWESNETRYYEFNNNEKFRYYRIQILQNAGYSSYTAISKIEFGYKNNLFYQLPILSKNNFVDYGQPLMNINGFITKKNYILQENASKDTDELWKVKLDRKPHSIKLESL